MAEMVNFNLANPYQAQLDALARRQQMADIMAQQSLQPMQTPGTYNGIQAPISHLSGLAKILEGYTAGKEERAIKEERKALGERYRQEGMDDITRYAEMAGRPAVAAVPGSAAFTPMGSDYEDRGNAPAFNLNEQGMVPAVDPIAARMRGQIDPSMIGQFKTPEMQRMALAAMLKQGELPAAFNLGAEETRFQPPVGGGAPVAIATGKAKPLPSPFAPINTKDFTQESVIAATKPDGTVDRSLLVAVTAAPTGNLAELAAENSDRKQKGLPPLSISQYREQIAKAGRPLAAPRERTVFDTTRGGTVNLDTQEFTPVVQKGVPIGGSPRPAPEAYSKQASALLNINDAITDYRKDLKGFNTVTALSPDQRTRVGQKYQNVLLQAKEMYNLGVLNGPDLTILEQIIANPLAIRTAAVSTDALIKQVDQLSGIIKRQNKNLARVYKQPEIEFDTQSATDPTDPLGIRNK
jgi:hypothetical protein